MMQFKLLAVAVGTTLLVAACGGGSDSAPAAVVKPTSLVSFGDSLSDVGTYKVGTVATVLGGGTYSVNGITAGEFPSKNWTELLATSMKIATPTCAAQTGLEGDPLKGLSVPVKKNLPGCFNYAQGGARVTELVGPGNKALGGGNATLGQTTVPVVAQIATHLARVDGGKFSGTELVTVMAGGNDAIMILGEVSAVGTAAAGKVLVSTLVPLLAGGATVPTTAAGEIVKAITDLGENPLIDTVISTALVAATKAGHAGLLSSTGPTSKALGFIATASAAAKVEGDAAGKAYAEATNPTNAINELTKVQLTNTARFTNAMATAAKELATSIKTQIIGNGAKYVVVVNLPDLSSSPLAAAMTDAQKQLPLNLAVFFNTVLEFELAGVPGVRVVDSFAALRSQVANPAAYKIDNATTPACDLTPPANGLATSVISANGTSLVCNSTNTIKKDGNFIDVSKYLFADSVHPTPYGYKLLADLVTKNLTQAGWL